MKRFSLLSRALIGVVAICLGFVTGAFGQGVTTGSLNGFVTDAAGHGVSGVVVTAVHTPTNTTFTATTGATGRFVFSGVPVGGPYTVSAKADGFSIKSITEVEVTLGESTDVMLRAVKATAEEIVQLEKYQVTASTTDLDSNTAGAGSVLSNRRIQWQPTVSNSFADLARTNPYTSLRAGSQIVALGMNSRFNSITLDGAKINDAFGLASSGLFSLQNPFSLEAVEQFSISLVPYDVRQSGFAGAAINAVSPSGTNQFHGKAYFKFTDANWQGKDITGSTSGTRPALKERTYGFSLGGPILKDRLFFYMNYERFFQDRAPITPSYVPSSDFLAAIDAAAAKLPGSPSLGTFGGASTSRLADTKRLVKLDWNITNDHRLMVRYSDTIGMQPNTGSINGTSFSQPASFPTSAQPSSFPNGVTGLSSNFYTLDVKEKVWASQLFSNWSSDLKTQLSYSNTKQDSVRDTPVKFPEIHVFNVPGVSNTGASITTGDAFRFGTEISSMGNELHIKTNTLGGSGDYVWRDYTFTIGADHESTNFLNLFRQGSYGVFAYSNLAAFQADKPSGFLRSVVQSGFPVADISKFEDTGVYAQVKWAPSPRFNATLGLRNDYISSPIAPPENTTFKNAFGITNSGTVDGTTTPAPRFSFNYAVDEERIMQVRGGIGVFLGRNPWVWISNSFGNTGVGRFNTIVSGATTPTLTQYLNGTYTNTDPQYKFDPANPIGTTNVSGTASSINLIKPGLKLPTIERSNLAVDRRLPFLDATLTLEVIHTEQLDALFVDNMNLKQTGTGVDGRALFAGSASSAPLVKGFANVIRTRDVHAGKSTFGSISLDHPFKNGWAWGGSYTRGEATEAQTLNSSTANSQWQFNPVFNQNTVEVARSDYEVRDRLQAYVARQFRFKNDYTTTVALYYEGRSGMPYSYVYANDLNNDGFGANDLVAVPSGESDARFDFSGLSAAQKSAYFAYLQSSGLSRYAGSYAPRNAFLTPWQNRLDLHVSQEIPVWRHARLEVFADFVNFGSFIARGFFNYIQTINTTQTNGAQTRSLGAATYVNGKIKPTLNNGATSVLGTDGAGNLIFTSSSSTIVPNNGVNRWQIESGVRLKF
jgi:hypothetical protein